MNIETLIKFLTIETPTFILLSFIKSDSGQLKEDENLRMEKERPEVEREGLDWQDWLACYVFLLNFIMPAFRDDLPNQTG